MVYIYIYIYIHIYIVYIHIYCVCVCVCVCVYTMEYYSPIKKNEILQFATMWMELESITLSEISESEKDKHHTTSLI